MICENLMKKIVQGIVICLSVQFTIGSSYGVSNIPLPRIDQNSVNRSRENPLQMEAPAQNSSIHMTASKEGVFIRVENGRLGDVLQKVANQTDIQFSIPNHLSSVKINSDIQASDWESGIKAILKDFSHVMVWNKNFGMKKVMLLGKNEWNPDENFDPATEGVPLGEMSRPAPKLSLSKLKRLIQTPPGKPFPSNLFADRQIRRYLELKGIHSPDEWEKPGKVRTVLHMAKKELNRLLSAKQILQNLN